MLFEYGVEPRVLSNWKDFRYLFEKFGISEGRLISRYARHWKKLVYEAVSQASVLDRKRIEEGLTRIDEKMKRRHGEWDEKVEWLTNAIAEHSKKTISCNYSERKYSINPVCLRGRRSK